MAAPVILISLDSSDESVGSSTSRVILFGTILAEIPAETPMIPPVALEVEATRVASPAGVLDLITYSSIDSDSSEVPPAPRIRVALCSSSETSYPTHDLPPAVRQIVPALPGVPRRPAILVLPGQESLVGQPYRTRLMRVRKMLTARKRVQARDSSFSSEDSYFDTLATIFTRPSRKRCRSPATLVPLAAPTPGALSPTEGSYEAYIKPKINFDVQADIDASTVAAETIAAFEDVQADINASTVAAETTAALKVGIGIEADVGVEVGIRMEREDGVEEEAESRDRGTIEIGIN
nr:hypothetical protein [Tanacetum cinerariifolium]